MLGFEGLLGLSSRDESAGPLLVDYLYEQGSIPERQFAILLSEEVSVPSSLTLGGYEKQGD